jgi:hypothetical protein
MQTAKKLETLDCVIASGGSLSAAVDLFGYSLVGLIMPAEWTTANITMQNSLDGTTFNNVYDYLGAEYTANAAAARFIALQPGDVIGLQSIKLRSGTAAVAVNQVAARTIKIVVRALL